MYLLRDERNARVIGNLRGASLTESKSPSRSNPFRRKHFRQQPPESCPPATKQLTASP